MAGLLTLDKCEELPCGQDREVPMDSLTLIHSTDASDRQEYGSLRRPPLINLNTPYTHT